MTVSMTPLVSKEQYDHDRRQGAIIPVTERLQLTPCKCGTERLPELKKFRGRSLAMSFFCRACGVKGYQAYAPERAAIKWNERQAAA